jgi:putative acetyltransferase
VVAETVIAAAPADSQDAVPLISELEAELAQHYPAESRHGRPAGCGGVQIFGTEYAELKRMYVRPEFRNRNRQAHARSPGRPRPGSRCAAVRLETGIHQSAAIRLYEAYGFRRRTAFAPYRDDPLSLYYEKSL